MNESGMRPGEWRDVISALESFLPYYERVNWAATFGLLPLWRAHVTQDAGKAKSILEIGSGPGGFARLLSSERVICLDPSVTMLAYVADNLDSDRYSFIAGLAEHLPFSSGSFDRVYCSFSFRDFMDKGGSLVEILRVLKSGGRLHVLDICRSATRLRRFLLDAWIRKGVPVAARTLVPSTVKRNWEKNPYVEFYRTYSAMASPGRYSKLCLESGFRSAHFEYLSLKAVFHLEARK